MKRKIILLIAFFATLNIVNGQKLITVDFSTVVDTIKDFLGGNKGPGTSSDFIHDEGLRFLRTHDYHGPADYCFYSSFWNTDGNGDFTDVNTNFDPGNSTDYNWTASDLQLGEIVNPTWL